MTALHLLARCGAVELVAAVERLGVDINTADEAGETILFHALRTPTFDRLVRLFIAKRGDVDRANAQEVS